MNISTQPGPRHTGSSDREAGFMLVFAVLLAALMLVALAAAAPVIAKAIRRDKEVEAQHRANEYVRAIRLYYRKNKTYPPSIDALENTNNIRYLRKQYIDPLTDKNDWRIIHVGENKTTVKGFFGQPLGGLNTSGAGGLGSASSLSSSGLGGTPSSTVSGGSALSAGFTGATIGGSSPGGSTPAGSTAGRGTTGSSTSGSSSSTNASSLGSGGIGQIMGVGTAKTGDSILNPNEQTTYETWEFLYDPKIELLYQQGSLFGGPPTVNSQSPSNMNMNPGQSNPMGGSNNTPNTPQQNTPQPRSPQ